MIVKKQNHKGKRQLAFGIEDKEISWLYDFLINVENIEDYPKDIQRFYWNLVGRLN